MDAILQALPDGEWRYARDLVDDVSRLSGKQVSSHQIGYHMRFLEDGGDVKRIASRDNALWRKTWRGGAAQPKVLNMISVKGVDDPK